jgi:lipopolysaccharide export LptBFGC system permease protein LptF
VLRIQRAILLELVGVFTLALIVVTAVLFAGFSLSTLGRYQGVDFTALLAILPTLLPLALAYAMPYAFLLATALTYGRLVADRELVAMRISGIHPRVAAAPALAMGAVLSLAALGSNGWVLPSAQEALRTNERRLIDLFLGMLSSSDRNVKMKGVRMSWQSYEPAKTPGGNGVFREFELDKRDTRTGALEFKLIGAEVRLRRIGERLWIETPLAYLLTEGQPPKVAPPRLEVGEVEKIGGPRVEIGTVGTLGATTDFDDIVGHAGFRLKWRDWPLEDLLYAAERGSVGELPTKRILVELHGRLAHSLAPFVFGLFAAAVALNLPARGRRLLPFLLAFLPVLLVHVPLMVAGKSLADAEHVPAWLGLWSGDAALLLGGTWLLRRAYLR